jgi:hypothetical protein
MNLISSLYDSNLLHIILIYVVGITILLSLGLSQTTNPKIFLLSMMLPFIVFISIVVVIGFDLHNINTLAQQPVSNNFVVTEQDESLVLKSKNKHFQSVTVPIVREYKDKYLVEYRSKIMFVNK